MRLVARITLAATFALPVCAVAGFAAASVVTPSPAGVVSSAPVSGLSMGGENAGVEVAADQTLPYADGAQATFSDPNATFIKVDFDALTLAPGDFVTLADPTGREVYTYHGDPTRGGAKPGDSAFTVHRRQGFAAMSVNGNAAVVTMHVIGPARTAQQVQQAGLAVHVDRYWHGFSPAQFAQANPIPEAVCGGVDDRQDRVCFRDNHPKEFLESATVARLVIGGDRYCTAWRVGSTDRLLTNNHCLATQADVSSSEVQFGYECQTCGGNAILPGVKVGGAELIMTSADLDFTLFSVTDFAAIQQFGALYIDPTPQQDGEQIFIPGHGDAKPLQIAMFDDTADGGACSLAYAVADAVNSNYNCDTNPGSSGSPVISRDTGKVVALHHLGPCPNRGVRMDVLYPQIQNLIVNDPVLQAPQPDGNGVVAPLPIAAP